MDIQITGSPLRYKLHYKKYSFSIWLIVSLLMVSGLLSGFSAYLAQSALARAAAQTQVGAEMRKPPSKQPDNVTKAPTSTPPAVRILAQDSFKRPDQLHWGHASDGQFWDADTNHSRVFSIVAGAGRIAGGNGAYQAVLGPVTNNAEVLVSGSVNHFDGTANLGALLGWRNRANWYKVFIDGNSLTLIKDVDGQTGQIARAPFAAQDQTSYTIRFRVVGVQLFARVWPTGASEPANWLIAFSDPAFNAGRGGVRVVLDDDTAITITSFQETSIPTAA